jgi:hypothetical protein
MNTVTSIFNIDNILKYKNENENEINFENFENVCWEKYQNCHMENNDSPHLYFVFLMYEFVEHILNSANKNGNILNGGFNQNNFHKQSKKIFRRRYMKIKSSISKKTKKNRKNRKNIKSRWYKQKGGFKWLVMFFIPFLTLIIPRISGIKQIEDKEVFRRLKFLYKNKLLVKNIHGSCSLNAMMFYNAITLEQFEYLSIKNIENKYEKSPDAIAQIISNNSPYFRYFWLSFKHYKQIDYRDSDKNKLEQIYKEYTNSLKESIIQLREKKNIGEHSGIISIFLYSVIESNEGHAVILWLNEKEELYLIDPQLTYNEDKLFLAKDNVEKMTFDNLDNTNMEVQYVPLWKYFYRSDVDVNKKAFIYENLQNDNVSPSIFHESDSNVRLTGKSIENHYDNTYPLRSVFLYFIHKRYPNLRGSYIDNHDNVNVNKVEHEL